MKNKVVRGLIIVCFLFLSYLVIGLSAPFLKTKEIRNKEFLDNQISEILKEKESFDRAKILETSESALDERIRLLEQAQEHIILSTFDMREGNSTNDMLSLLVAKAKSGVSVDILIDGISASLRIQDKEIFEVLASTPNVTIKFYNEINIFAPYKLMGRMHDKYLIVDDFGYILGGRNTFDYFLGTYETEGKSLDRDVLIYNANRSKTSSLFQVKKYFEELWNSKECTIFKGYASKKNQEKVYEFLNNHLNNLKQSDLFFDYDYDANTLPTKGVHLLSNPTHVYGKEPTVFYQLVELMKTSKKEIRIHTPYAVFNDVMIHDLTLLSKDTQVKLVLNSEFNGDNLMASSDYIRHKKDILNTGMKIMEYNGGISSHGKSIVIDNSIAIIGSYNFDLRSTYVDTELMLVINSEPLTEELLFYMDDLEKDAIRLNEDGSYDNKNNITVQKPSNFKKNLWKVIGFVLQPFRVLV